MPDRLKVLLLEEDAEDAQRVLNELRCVDFEPCPARVDEESEYLAALDEGLDVILANYSLPGYDALRALDALRERRLDVPLIVVSRVIDEETVVMAMKAGAADCLRKDRLSRLGASIRRAMEQRGQAVRWRAMEQALPASEERFRLIAQATSDVIFEWDSVADRISYFVHPAAKLGYDEFEYPRTLADWVALVHPDDRERMLAGVEDLLNGLPQAKFEYRVVLKSGVRYRTVHYRMLPRADGPPTVILGAVSDITERVRTQERIASMNDECRELSARLVRSQDEERRRFARELHDSTAQSLTALSFSLGMLSGLNGIDAVPEARRMLGECAAAVEGCIREVRTMSFLLHPLLLDDVGLESALRNFVCGFEQRTGIAVTFFAAVDRVRWKDCVETAAFRFVQEALSNVHRHARATHVEVRIVESDRMLTLHVADDGKGFPAGSLGPDETPSSVGVGIAGMRERARHLGGALKIHSTSLGSTLTLTVPTDEKH